MGYKSNERNMHAHCGDLNEKCPCSIGLLNTWSSTDHTLGKLGG